MSDEKQQTSQTTAKPEQKPATTQRPSTNSTGAKSADKEILTRKDR